MYIGRPADDGADTCADENEFVQLRHKHNFSASCFGALLGMLHRNLEGERSMLRIFYGMCTFLRQVWFKMGCLALAGSLVLDGIPNRRPY